MNQRINEFVKFFWKYDEEVTKQLENANYHVLRFWEKDINENLSKCVEKIKQTIEKLNEFKIK